MRVRIELITPEPVRSTGFYPSAGGALTSDEVASFTSVSFFIYASMALLIGHLFKLFGFGVWQGWY